MNVERYIADRITSKSKDQGSISKPIVKIGILGIILGLSVMLLTVSIVVGFKKEITKKVTGLAADVTISNISFGSNGEQVPVKISADSINILKKIPNVKHVQGCALKNGIVKTKTENEGVVIKGIDANYDLEFIKKHMLSGKLPELKGADASNDILISENLATRLDLKAEGKFLVYFVVQHDVYDSIEKANFTKFEQRSRNFKICGIYKTSFSDFDNNLTFVDIRHIQKLNYWGPGVVGNYEVRVNDFEKLESTIEAINDNTALNCQVISVKDSFSNIFIWLDKLDINGVIIIVLMILVAVINMITALLILILERTNMVGMLKSLGMSNVNVRRIFFYISLKLLSRGLLWGNIVGIGMCLIQYYFGLVKLDSSTYYVDKVAIDLNWMSYLMVNLGTTVVCLAMLLLPTLILTKITPIKTLRFD
ncbi:MAG: ABC transporter permease [Sphingobacteriaceae bacterium]|nr:ABC transporter permease [Sphingobacteriaceae bacterium]